MSPINGSTCPFSIAIIGGGISGVVLAISLLKRNIPVKLYEQAQSLKEIGAGVAFTPNASWSMQVCDPKIREVFDKVAVGNKWESKKHTYFDLLDGHTNAASAEQTAAGKDHEAQEPYLFSSETSQVKRMVHRADFLDGMVHLIPEHVVEFGKHLDTISESHDGTMVMHFHDGTTASADAIIGCDGIKSLVRAHVLGPSHPSVKPVYTHKYAYRGLMPVDEVTKAIGEDNASNAKIHCGPGGHILTFPVANGTKLNLVAFVHDNNDWTQAQLTRPAHKHEAMHDFRDWSPTVRNLLTLLQDDLSVWAIFDTGDHPLPHYNKGLVCLLGDAAHATSPHMGSGAGMCIEDCAVMSELLADAGVHELAAQGGEERRRALRGVFQTFNDARKERTQWLVQSSRYFGNLYDFMIEGIDAKKEPEKMKAESEKRLAYIWDGDVEGFCRDAKEQLQACLA